MMGHIFRNEYNDRDPRPQSQLLRDRIDALVQFKEVVFDEKTGAIELVHQNNPERSFLLNYFNRTSQFVFDAYLIVLSALEAICEANLVVNETKLVNELHASIIQMYDDNLIKELPSCLKELL